MRGRERRRRRDEICRARRRSLAPGRRSSRRLRARARALRRRRRRRPIRAPAPRRERARRRRSARRRWESGVASRRQSCKLSAVNLLHLFDLSLRARAADAALEWAGETYTFADVESRSNRVARALQAAGFAKGDRLCVHLANRIELIDLYLACVKLGVIFVPINVLYRERELAHIMSDAEPRALITSDNLPEPAADDSRPATEIDGADPAAILYPPRPPSSPPTPSATGCTAGLSAAAACVCSSASTIAPPRASSSTFARRFSSACRPSTSACSTRRPTPRARSARPCASSSPAPRRCRRTSSRSSASSSATRFSSATA